MVFNQTGVWEKEENQKGSLTLEADGVIGTVRKLITVNGKLS